MFLPCTCIDYDSFGEQDCGRRSRGEAKFRCLNPIISKAVDLVEVRNSDCADSHDQSVHRRG